MIRPSERHELQALKAAGFTGYLVSRCVPHAGGAPCRHRHSSAFGKRSRRRNRRHLGSPGQRFVNLVAEDNEINALLARALLTRLGHRPTIAVNGEAAVESWLGSAVLRLPVRFVLMDLQMPGSMAWKPRAGFVQLRLKRATPPRV